VVEKEKELKRRKKKLLVKVKPTDDC